MEDTLKIIIKDCMDKELNVSIYVDLKTEKNDVLKVFNGYIEGYLGNDVLVLNEFNNPGKPGDKSYIPIKKIIFIQSRVDSTQAQVTKPSRSGTAQTLSERLNT